MKPTPLLAMVPMLGLGLSSLASGAYTQIASLAEILGTSGANGFNAFAVEGQNLYATVTGPSGTYAITQVSGLNGAKSSSILISQPAIAAVNSGASNLSGATGFGFRSAGQLQFGDSNSNSIYRVDTSSGAISTYVGPANITANPDIATANLLAIHGNVSNGEYAFYNTAVGSRGLFSTASAGNVSTLISSSGLVALNSSDQLFGGIASSGDNIYFAIGSTAGSRNLYSYSLSLSTAALVFTEAQIASLNSNGTAFSLSDIFAAPDGIIYLRNTQSRDIFRFDPSDPLGTLELAISRAALEAGPANTALVTQLGWYEGELAFAVTGTGGGAVAGVYAIPEPSTAILSLLALTAFFRRRR